MSVWIHRCNTLGQRRKHQHRLFSSPKKNVFNLLSHLPIISQNQTRHSSKSCMYVYILTSDYPAYRDQTNRHISASENDRLILKTVPERVFSPILLSINFILVRPILWPQFYIECKLWSLDLQKMALWMFAQQICILSPNLDKLIYFAGIGLEW